MRRTDRELRDPADIRAILEQADALHLALADNDTPYLVTLNFGIRPGEPLALYLHCAHEGRKIEMLKRNPRACFGVDVGREVFQSEKGTSCGYSMRYRSVVGSGRMAFVTDPAEKVAGLAAIMDHYAPGTHRFADKMVAQTTGPEAGCGGDFREDAPLIKGCCNFLERGSGLAPKDGTGRWPPLPPCHGEPRDTVVRAGDGDRPVSLSLKARDPRLRARRVSRPA